MPAPCPHRTSLPKSKRAAVLVLVYEKGGVLRVLLTTRAKTLRTHPGQTALPGGKMDEADQDITDTAHREAFEEVALPRTHPAVHTLCVLRPFIAWTRLIVTPVVALLTDLSILESLKPSQSEVDKIFDHPLEAFLEPSLSAPEPLVALNSEQWPSDAEYYNFTDNTWDWLGTSYRMHRFRSCASTIKGLTAEILTLTGDGIAQIQAAAVAYDRKPSFTWYAPGQLTTFSAIIGTLAPGMFAELRETAAPPSTAEGVVLGRE
ncbi:hypothetical protein EIP86_000694 [Pleurotus ostreatoroseus]|nr:hypothetical protein EIP86_000694 [Pleurotus ostreatoroseus]